LIYRNFQPWQLAFARIIIFGVLTLDLATDDITSLAAFPREAFVPHGVLRLCPDLIAQACASAETLTAFKWIALVLFICGIVGFGPTQLVVSLSLLAAGLFYGAARGYGGHVNHQELLPFHSLFFLLFGNAFSVWSLNHWLSKERLYRWCRTPDPVLQQFVLRTLCFNVVLTYWLIGIARIESSGVAIYFTNSMHCWVLQHSCKWNWWTMDIGAGLNEAPWLSSSLQLLFPAATVLELAAPLALFFHRLTLPIVLSLVLFHLSIFLFMNIFFWQNLVLLSLLLVGWRADCAAKHSVVGHTPALVLYDSDCGMCDSFIAWLARNDVSGALSFAPLRGVTARSLGVDVNAPSRRWSLVLVRDSQKLERSDAILEALKTAHVFVDFANFGLAVPRPLRDAIYSSVAAIRRLIPLRKKLCTLAGRNSAAGRFLP
jgi:predicted DCC family thiol-disulfide oxidoreductase YuxK